MKESIKHLDCKICKSKESVKYSIKMKETYVEVKIGKCENCKYQHGIKELC